MMHVASGLSPRRSKAWRRAWIAVFFAGLFAIVGGMYYASVKVEYIWRWYQVPDFFWTTETITITANYDGDVSSITNEGGGATVVVTGLDGENEAYAIPAGGEVQVSRGDMISPGDVLGSIEQSKPGVFIEATWLTLKVSILGIILGIVLGLVTGLARLSDNPALKWSAITYIELIRGSPLLVQIFIWYFVLGTVINQLFTQYGLPQIPELWFGVASLAIFAGAYIAEIVRAGIQSVHRGQVEAARSLGMTSSECMTHVILPQAMRRILPPLAGQFISLIKDSSLLGIIAIRELSKGTRELASTFLMPFELWITCAAIYLLLTFSLSMLLQWLERKWLVSR